QLTLFVPSEAVTTTVWEPSEYVKVRLDDPGTATFSCLRWTLSTLQVTWTVPPSGSFTCAVRVVCVPIREAHSRVTAVGQVRVGGAANVGDAASRVASNATPASTACRGRPALPEGKTPEDRLVG